MSSSNNRSTFTPDEQPISPLRGNEGHQRQHEAQAAYATNAEVPALTPRTSANAWGGGNRAFSFSGLGNDARKTAAQSTDPFSGASARPGQSSEAEVVEAKPSSSTDTDPHWQPSLAVGSIDAPNLGAKEAARRHMLQWEHIYAYNRSHHPSVALQTILERLAFARNAYEQLCRVSEQDQQADAILPLVQQPSHQQEQIERRVALLQRTLLRYSGEEFAAMRRNIAAALEGYKNEEIRFSDSFTLIYAGRIVDKGKCRSWADFTVDRQQRLDRYCEKYGEGYLWWEPPLLAASGSGGSAEGGRMLAKKGIALNLSREDTMYSVQDAVGRVFRDGACHYKVPLGFKKDDSLRCRQPLKTERAFDLDVDAQERQSPPEDDNQKKSPNENEETQVERKLYRKRARDDGQDTEPAQSAPSSRKLRGSTAKPRTTILKQQAERKHQSRTETVEPPAEATAATQQAETKEKGQQKEEDSSGPTVFFNMVLDSGAELPLLLYDDLKLLGFHTKDFNAASVIELDCVGGLMSESLTFELLAGLELRDQPANNTGRDAASSSSTTSSAAAAIHQHTRSPESHFFPSRVLMLGPDVKAPPYGGFSTHRLSGILPFLAYYTASAPGNGQMAFSEERAEVLGRRNMPFGLRYDPFDDGHHGDLGKQQQQQQLVKARMEKAVAKIGGAHLGMQKVRFEYAMENGHVLMEQDTFSRDGRRVTTTVALVEHDGTVVREYRCVPSKEV